MIGSSDLLAQEQLNKQARATEHWKQEFLKLGIAKTIGFLHRRRSWWWRLIALTGWDTKRAGAEAALIEMRQRNVTSQ